MALSRKPIEIVNQGNHQLLAKANHWERVALSEVAKIQNGFAFKSELFTHSEGKPLIRIRDIENGETQSFYTGDYSNEFIVKKGDILIGMDGDFNAAIWQGVDSLLNQRVCRILPTSSNFSEDFLFICLQPYLHAINQETSSVTVKHLSSVTIGEIPLPLPPLAEQHRIVAKIEELFSELDKGIENLKTARAQLKVYRQALLKHAFEGKLTAQWREQNKEKLETASALQQRIQIERAARYQEQLADWQAADHKGSKPKAPKPLPPLTDEELAELNKLPDGWAWVKLSEICEKITDGDHQAPPQTKEGIPFITISDIKNQKIDFSDTRYVSNKYYESLSEERKPTKNDILYTVTGSFGIPSIVDFDRKFCFQRHIGLIRSDNNVNNKFLFYLLSSQLIYSQAVKVATGTAQKTVPLGGLRLFKIPLTSRNEQHEIVMQLELKLSEVEQLDQTITTALQQSEALRQSTLKKAFSGALVPQDANDEPASVLLARIKAEIAAKPANKRLAKDSI